MTQKKSWLLLCAAALVLASPAAMAREYFIGGPVHKFDMEIVANYLVGVEMAPMTANSLMFPKMFIGKPGLYAPWGVPPAV